MAYRLLSCILIQLALRLLSMVNGGRLSLQNPTQQSESLHGEGAGRRWYQDRQAEWGPGKLLQAGNDKHRPSVS